jgi:hypothetical protein
MTSRRGPTKKQSPANGDHFPIIKESGSYQIIRKVIQSNLPKAETDDRPCLVYRER